MDLPEMSEEEKFKLMNLLNEWDMKYLGPYFFAQRIHVKTLKRLKSLHIPMLIEKFPLGVQIDFEYNLKVWRQRIGEPLLPAFKTNDFRELQTIEMEETHQQKFEAAARAENIQEHEPTGNMTLNSKPKTAAVTRMQNTKHERWLSTASNESLLDYIKDLKSNTDNISIRNLVPEQEINFTTVKKEQSLQTNNLNTNESSNCSDISKGFLVNGEMDDDDDDDNDNDDCDDNCKVVNEYIEEETEILLQTIFKNCKKFVKTYAPYSYHDFLASACSAFNISNEDNYVVVVNDCPIEERAFRTIIMQYYKTTTFALEILEKSQLAGVLNGFSNTCHHNNNYIPSAQDIKNMLGLLTIVKMSEDGKPLENKQRNQIAKSVMDECLNHQPDRLLKREDFFQLSENIVAAFPKEIISTYYIASERGQQARGKLWNAYNNKRYILSNSGILSRRHRSAPKRKYSSSEDQEQEHSKITFLEDSKLDCEA